jgi:hypothetical protein
MQSALTEPRPARLTTRDLTLGALAGLGGGLAMGVTGMLVAAALGMSIWTPLNEIAGVFSTGRASDLGEFNASMVLLGTAVHFAIAAALGILFALLYRGLFDLPSSFGFPLLYGFLYGIVIWLISDQVLSGTGISAINYTPWFIVQHLIFGATTGLIFGQLRPARAYLPRAA